MTSLVPTLLVPAGCVASLGDKDTGLSVDVEPVDVAGWSRTELPAPVGPLLPAAPLPPVMPAVVPAPPVGAPPDRAAVVLEAVANPVSWPVVS